MEFIGFYGELDPSGPKEIYKEMLKEVVEIDGSYQASRIIAYLDSGHPILDVMESTPDPLSPGVFVRGGASILTDGKWVWRYDLHHYVDRYRVPLPAEFVRDAAAANYAVPRVDVSNLRELSIAVSKKLGYRPTG